MAVIFQKNNPEDWIAAGVDMITATSGKVPIFGSIV